MRVLFFSLVFAALNVYARDPLLKAKDIFIKVESSKQQCFPGEPIVVSYSLYTRLSSESKVIKRPTFKGFGVYDLEPPETGKSTIIKMNGEEFSVFLLRKVQLYPLQPGRFTLEPMELENSVLIEKKTHQETIKSEEISIQVNDFPADKGKLFNGAVGLFTIESAVRQNGSYRVNDILEFELTVRGRGNFPMLNMPEINWPSGIETYAPKIKEAYSKTTVPIEGSKTFIVPFIVKEAGKKVIPTIVFSYFDPQKRRFTEIRSTPVRVDILAPVSAATSNTKKPVEKNRTTWYFIFPVLLVILILSTYFLQKKKPNDSKSVLETKDEQKWDDEYRIKLQSLLEQGNATGFYKTLTEGLDKYMYVRFGLVREQWVNAKGNNLMSEESYALVVQLHERATFILYTPGHKADGMQEDYKRFSELIR